MTLVWLSSELEQFNSFVSIYILGLTVESRIETTEMYISGGKITLQQYMLMKGQNHAAND